MSWEYYNGTNYEEAIAKAVEMGWKDRNVQVRVEFRDYVAWYFIEPFETNCSCPHILKYKDHVHDPIPD